MHDQRIPLGYCQCGCGQRTRIAHETKSRYGHIKGQPVRFLPGHHNRRTAHDYEIRDCGYETPCWVWVRSTTTHGYGQTHDDQQRMRGAHVVYYERHIGPIPEGLELDHLCRVRACVNPAHLEPVTSAVNTRRGKNTRLTMEIAEEIRTRAANGERHADIAEAFGISCSHARGIIYHQKWKRAA